MVIWDFILERWSVQTQPEPEIVWAITAAVVLLTAVPSVWRILRQASTIVHEMGHVFAALLSGRRVSGIKLHTDTSGVTVSRGKPKGPGMLFTALAGYPAPGLLGLGMAVLLTTGHAGAALTLYQVVMLLALILSRNAVGIFSCLVSLLATGAVWWINHPEAVVWTVTALAVFYALAGVRGTFDLIRVHIRDKPQARSSDAGQAARAWGRTPVFLWLLFFLLAGFGAAAGTVWLLI